MVSSLIVLDEWGRSPGQLLLGLGKPLLLALAVAEGLAQRRIKSSLPQTVVVLERRR